jgi:hypothetical protein
VIDVEAYIEPPDLEDGPDDEGRPTIGLYVNLLEGDGTYRTAHIHVDAEATDTEVADALISCIQGVAAMRGPGLVEAIRRKLEGQ